MRSRGNTPDRAMPPECACDPGKRFAGWRARPTAPSGHGSGITPEGRPCLPHGATSPFPFRGPHGLPRHRRTAHGSFAESHAHWQCELEPSLPGPSADRPSCGQAGSPAGPAHCARQKHVCGRAWCEPGVATHVSPLWGDPCLARRGGIPTHGTAHSQGAPGSSPCAAGERAIGGMRRHKKWRASISATLRRARRALGRPESASRDMPVAGRGSRLVRALRDVANGADARTLISALCDEKLHPSADVSGFLLAGAPWALERLVPRLARFITARWRSRRALAGRLAEGRLPKTLVYIMDECVHALSHGSDPASGDGALADGVERLVGRLSNDAQDMCSAHAERQPSGRGYGSRVELDVERRADLAGPPASARGGSPAKPRLLSPAQKWRAVATILLVMLARIATILWCVDDAHSLLEALPDLLRCVAHLRTLRAG